MKRQLMSILKNGYKNHSMEIFKKRSIKDAHIYCKINKLSGQEHGPLLEKFIKAHNGMEKNNASDCMGDCSKNNLNYEIKTSLGGKTHDRFNYVQLRLNHSIDYYLFTAYHLNIENIKTNGELFNFLIDKRSMKNLVLKYGHYAHGTITKNGVITRKSLNDSTLEYAIRPVYGDSCWKELLKFQNKENT